MSDRRKTKKDIHVTSEDENLEVNKHEHAAIFEGENESTKAVSEPCPILLWYMYNYIAGYLLLIIIYCTKYRERSKSWDLKDKILLFQ